MATGKATGTPVKLGPAPGRSDRLASSIRLIPGYTPPVTEWAGTYSGQVADVTGPPFGAAEQV
jgi:hypothetical protein